MEGDMQLTAEATNVYKTRARRYMGMAAVLSGISGIIFLQNRSVPLSIICAIVTILGYVAIELSDRSPKDEPISESELAFARKYDREYGAREAKERQRRERQPIAQFQTEDPNSFDSQLLKLYGLAMPKEEIGMRR